jgi:hypothetical protein
MSFANEQFNKIGFAHFALVHDWLFLSAFISVDLRQGPFGFG